MKKFLIIAVIVSMTLFSCDQSLFIYIEKNVSQSKVLTYAINTTGNINQRQSLSIGTLIETLTNDIKSHIDRYGYTIKELSIQSVDLQVIKNANNTANTVNISSLVIDNTGGSSTSNPILRETNLPVNEASATLVNSYLLFAGVDKVNNALAAAIKKISPSGSLDFDIKGAPVPANSRVSATLNVNITFNMRYSYCEETFLLVVSRRDDNCIKL